MIRKEKNDLEQLIRDLLRIKIKLLERDYYLVQQRKNMYTINYANLNFPLPDISNIVSVGIPIITGNPSKITLLPGILNCLDEKIRNYKINKSEVNRVSHGYSIGIDTHDRLLILHDKYNRRIAFGKVEDNYFKPIVDIGLYLRNEKLF